MYDPVAVYIDQAVRFLVSQTGDDPKTIRKYVVDTLKSHPIKNPQVTYLERDTETKDRRLVKTTLRDYILSGIESRDIFVPSFTRYLNKEIEESFHTTFIDQNMRIRKEAKSKALSCRVKGDTDGYNYWNTIQYAKKISNNSLSGAYASSGTILNNPSAHYTLTSITRCVSGIGNAVTEKMVGGHRHYRHPQIVLNDIAALLDTVDLDRIRYLIDKYELHIPSVDETMDMILYSTRRYFVSSRCEEQIRQIVSRLSEVERSAFVYVNDLYHLRRYNENLVRQLIGSLSKRIQTKKSYPQEAIHQYDEADVMLAHHILADEIEGLGSDYEEMKKRGIYDDLVATVENIVSVYDRYQDLIDGLFFTEHLPISIAYIQTMLREVTVLSDTDSTCATYQDWVEWYFGEIGFTQKHIAVSATVMILNSKMISHYLEHFTRSMQASESDLGVLKMKNEFYWDVMTPMTTTKHYYAAIRIQEGNVLKKRELELKGIHLIGSKVYKEISTYTRQLIWYIIDQILTSQSMSLRAIVDKILDVERMIVDHLRKSDTDIFLSVPIKDKQSYKQDPELSKYNYHLIWERVFEPVYGTIDDPPYTGIKIPVTITNKTRLKEWIESIENAKLRSLAIDYFSQYRISGLAMFVLSKPYVKSHGIPDEIARIIDTERLVSEICKSLYLILESSGYPVDDHFKTLHNQLGIPW